MGILKHNGNIISESIFFFSFLASIHFFTSIHQIQNKYILLVQSSEIGREIHVGERVMSLHEIHIAIAHIV